MHKVQKCLKWCNYAHAEKNIEKPLKKQTSFKWAFICVFSRMQVYIYISHQNGKGLPKIIVVYHIP